MASGLAGLGRDGGIAYGGDYNPEQWGRATWIEDVALMREAGVSLVTVGVFAWSTLEPAPGRFETGWLDEVLDLLHDAGIGVDLATPVASPPPWLAAEHPDTLPVDRFGRTLHPGSRSHFCPSARAYRAAAVSIADRVAARYAGHPAVRLWHAGNEYGQVCYCEHSAAAFRTWLRERYGDLDRLNDAWATAVWSQGYRDWAEVTPPRAMPYHGNPARDLDFRRFCSDELLALYREQRAAIRRHDAVRPITTNLMGFFAGLDPDAWRADLDVVADDAYPDPADPHAAADAALVNHLNRGLAGGPWMRMEQAASAVSWREHNLPKSPDRLRAEVVQAVAQGCDAVGFFQWRQARSGPERFHSAMLPNAGADSEVFRGIVRLGADVAALRPLVGTAVDASVAILWDWSSWWAATTEAVPTSRLDPLATLRQWHRALWRRGVSVDVLTRPDDLDRYAVVLAPVLTVLDPERAGRLTAYVEGGGSLVWGPFGGVCDELGHLWPGRAPALLRDLLGVSSEEWAPLPDGGCAVTGPGLPAGRASILGERTRSDSAEVLATYADGPLAGSVAAARHTHAAGRTLYVGATLDDDSLGLLLAGCLTDAGVPTSSLPDDVELTVRGDAVVVVNHSGASVHLDLDDLAPEYLGGGHALTDLLGGPGPVDGGLALAPYAAVVLVREHPPVSAGAR